MTGLRRWARRQLPITTIRPGGGSTCASGWTDNVIYRRGEPRARDNAQLVERTVRIARELRAPAGYARRGCARAVRDSEVDARVVGQGRQQPLVAARGEVAERVGRVAAQRLDRAGCRRRARRGCARARRAASAGRVLIRGDQPHARRQLQGQQDRRRQQERRASRPSSRPARSAAPARRRAGRSARPARRRWRAAARSRSRGASRSAPAELLADERDAVHRVAGARRTRRRCAPAVSRVVAEIARPSPGSRGRPRSARGSRRAPSRRSRRTGSAARRRRGHRVAVRVRP